MKTTIYLVRHGATEGHLAESTRLAGRRQDPPLSRLGVRQAELTRNLLGVRPIDCCYSSPLLRARQTAEILAAPHGLGPVVCPDLIECDVGTWQGLDSQAIRYFHADSYRLLKECPREFRFPGGEAWCDIQARIAATLERFFEQHSGQSILVVGHHLVNATFLADLMGIIPHHPLQV